MEKTFNPSEPIKIHCPCCEKSISIDIQAFLAENEKESILKQIAKAMQDNWKLKITTIGSPSIL
ncbi:MAG: hypothetical protein A3F67_05105 [Verrucomicrobia bacterium RIFCSPHIGHO2_12_FULL_41_10]|nr:MAG: hypothetical protein A3F67_05105 [Verrucomicrobia bacterium RIFCSPHIGHO2_12_FULL_41_10]